MADSKLGAYSGRLYDHSTGEWVDVPESEVAAKVLTGKFTYETGIDVPVVAPDGEIGSISSDMAHDAFSKGFKPVTKDLQQAYQEKQLEEIDRTRFGNMPVEAAVAGALRGASLGLTDVVGSATGLELDKLKEQNPVASTAGEIAGIAATTLTGIGPVAQGAKMAVQGGAKLAAKIATGGIAKKVASSALSGAAEGAFFGVGQGITESALGNPEDTVNNLISNVGAGVLFGGVLGAGFGAAGSAKPYVSSLFEKAMTNADDIVQSAARSTVAKAGSAALSRKGLDDLGSEFKELAENPEFRRYVAENGVDVARLAMKEAQVLETAANVELKAIRTDLHSAVKNASQEARQVTEELIETSGGNIKTAIQSAGTNRQLAQEQLERNISVFSDPAKHPGSYEPDKLASVFEDAAKGLRGLDNPTAIRAASRIEAYQTSAGQLLSQADEASLFLRISDDLKNIKAEKIGKAGAAIVDDIIKQSDHALQYHPNPVISESYKLRKIYDEVDSGLRAVGDRTIARVTKSAMPGEEVLGVKNGASSVVDAAKTYRTLINPQNRETVQTVLNQFDQFAPELKMYSEIQAIKDSVEKLSAQAALQEAIEVRVKGFLPKAKVNADEVEDIFSLFGKVKPVEVDKSLNRLRELQASLDPDTSEVARAMAISKALGQPNSKSLESIAKYEAQFAKLERLREVAGPAISMRKAALGAAVMGDFLGAAFGGQKTTYDRYLSALTQFEKASEQGFKIVSKAIKGAANSLTGAEAKAAFKAGMIVSEDGPKRNLKEKAQHYRNLVKQLEVPIQPSAGNNVLPQLQKAIDQKHQQVKSFLAGKIPEDPFIDTNLSLKGTKYLPSNTEMAKFFRYVDSVDNPVKILNNIQKGKISVEGVEVLKEIYPQIYKQLQDNLLDSIIEGKVELPYRKRLELGILFDIPTDYSLKPEVIARLQFAINKEEGGRPEGTGGQRKVEINLKPSETLATQSQKTTYDL